MENVTWSDLDSVKKRANNGFGLGLAGTIAGGLALLGGNGIGGIFGGNGTASTCTNADSNACAFVSKDTFWRQNVDLERELGVQRYDNLKANYDLYITLDNKISALSTKQAQYDAALPLTFQIAKLESERYADNKCCKCEKEMLKGFSAVEYQLAHKIDGTLGLPYSSIITGIPTFPQCTLDVTCPTTGA